MTSHAPPDNSRSATDAEAGNNHKSAFLPSFPTINSPSANYNRNHRTIAYRLSESVFGSLLASYVLGFVAFAAFYIQSPQALHVGSTPAVNPMHLILLPIVLLEYLLISINFSIFTALVYFNYHHSIMFISSDQRKASIDFLISVFIGVGFGLSMLFPRAFMLFIAVLIVWVLCRQWFLLKPYWHHLADNLNLLSTDSNPVDATARRTDDKKAIELVRKALSDSKNPVLRSWGGGGRRTWLYAYALGMILVSLFISLACAINIDYRMGCDALNVVFCLILVWKLFTTLFKASQQMPAQDEQYEAQLVHDLDDLLARVKRSEMTVSTVSLDSRNSG